MPLTLPIVITVQDQVVAKSILPLRLHVVPDALISGDASVCIGVGVAAVWTVVVRVTDMDVSSQIIGDVLVDAEEGAARIAEFTIRPPAGTVFAPTSWVGSPVTIDVADFSTGAPRYPMRLFTGVVDVPVLNHQDRTIQVRCTDDLQGRCDAMDNAALSSLIGGYASPAVFDAAATGWRFAQDRLSTTPSALDISPAGALRVTSWIPKSTPDIILDDALVGDGSIAVQLPERSALTNEVAVEFNYRFPRVKAEGYSVVFELVNMSFFAQFLLDDNWFLQRAQVESAISSAGGTIESITYTPLPDEIIAVGSGFFTPSAADAGLCMGFDADVSFDYSQTVEEQHRIRVYNQRSIDAIGLRRDTLTGSLEGEYPDIVAVETGIRLYKAKVLSIPPANRASVMAGTTTASEVTLTSETDRAAAEAAMKALIAMAKVRIYGSHRSNRVSVSVPLIPAIDLDKTLYINADGVEAQGKCVRVVHRLSPGSGVAISETTIAVCSVSGVGIVHDEDPTAASEGTTTGATPLSGSVEVVYNSGPSEDHAITITFPGITDADRNLAITVIPSAVAAPLFEDELQVVL